LSRLLITAFIFANLVYMASPLTQAVAQTGTQTSTQTISNAEITAQIETQRRQVAVDQYGCVKYPKGDEIVVCGPNTENERQKLPKGPVDNDRIRHGEAVSSTRAAARDRSGCGKVGIDIGCTVLPKNTVAIGKPPPPMPPDFADVVRGLPEPEDVVSEGAE
jgi:hypothetical protein